MDLKEEILSRCDIKDVVEDTISLRKQGSRFVGCCPIHKEKTPSFYVTPSMNMWKCFGCGAGGNVIDFVMQTQNLPFWEAMCYLAKKHNIPIPKSKPEDTAEGLHTAALFEANKQAQSFFISQLKLSDKAKAYVESRWGMEFAQSIGIGYAPDDWHGLNAYVLKNNLNRKLFEELGLIKVSEEKQSRYDFYRDRITIPIYDRYGRVIGFTARYIGTDAETQKERKYFNSCDSAVYNKNKSVFGINYAAKAARRSDMMFIVEGAPDVLRLESIGIANAVACLGSRCTKDQFKLIQAYTNNICFIPDCDVLKDGATFATGFQGTIDNAKLALECGFSVFVKELPQEDKKVKVDCDSYVTSTDIFQSLEQVDFISWYSSKLLAGEQTPDNQSKAIAELSATIALIGDSVKAELVIEQIGKISTIKNVRSMLRRSYTNALAEVQKKRTVHSEQKQIDLLDQYGFWTENNAYYSAADGKIRQWSNFTLQPLFHIKDVVFPKRLFKITNGRQTEIIELKAEDLVSLQKFKQKVEGLGNFIWQVKDEQLTKLKTYLYEQTETAVEIKQLGWNKDGFFAFGNGIYNDGCFYEADDMGIVRLQEKGNYYLPAKSMIYAGDRTLFEFEKNFSHLGYNNCTLTEAFTKIATVYGDNGIMGLAFYMAALFKDVVLHNTSLHFPILNLFGPKGSGKTELAVSLKRFFQLKDMQLNLNNTTIAAIANNLAQVSNAIVHFDEFRNDLDTRIRESLKGVWDNTGRSRMSLDRDKQVESTLVDCALILSGQEMATADIALFSRFVFLRFANTTFTAEAKKHFNELSELQRKGFSHITLQLLNYRPQVEKEISAALTEVSKELAERLGRTLVEDRILGNYKVLLVIYKIIGKYVTLPFSYDKVFNICFDYMMEQQGSCFTSNELANFWECVQVLVQNGELTIESDFRIQPENSIVTDIAKIEYQSPRLVLYIRPSRIFQLYAKQYRSLGETCLPRQSLKYYLEQSKEYLGKKNCMRFKFIVRGQEVRQTESSADGVQSLPASQNDRAMAFDYEAIMNNYNIDINSYTQEDLPE